MSWPPNASYNGDISTRDGFAKEWSRKHGGKSYFASITKGAKRRPVRSRKDKPAPATGAARILPERPER